ncbi:MAG TPA: hypothetical protein VHH73_07745 [Verrucomicrobiae bacterium]|nr:hypothetical protein [Verrucomicrobiae bacterium]
MSPRIAPPDSRRRREAGQRASVLIVVLWVAFGLIALALYFANSMSLELKASDNGLGDLEAEKAIEGAARYVSNVLALAQMKGVLPDTNTYYYANVAVGEATFWLIGRSDADDPVGVAHFGLVDEGSRLDLNKAGTNMLQYLPNMTQELMASIIDWRDTNETVSLGGAESETYQQRTPPYRCKNANFETVDELRMVYGATPELLYGEDVNLNGILDRNENDGDTTPPSDNQDSKLNPGMLEFFTVYSRQPTTDTNGTNRIIVTGLTNLRQQLGTILQAKLGDRGNDVLSQLTRAGGGGAGAAGTPMFNSVMQFYIRSGMTAAEFALVEDVLMNPTNNCQVNVNTASAEVLACIPGIGYDNATTLVSTRRAQAGTGTLSSIAWVRDALGNTAAQQAGPYITGKSFQFCADIAAIGHFGRGYRRVKFIFDTSQGIPRIVYRQDLTHLGWALGRDVLLAQQNLARNR